MKKLFYFLLALPLMFVACGEKGDEPKEEPQSKEKLELLSADTMEFECVGGQGEITFLYEGNNLNTNAPSTPTTGKTAFSSLCTPLICTGHNNALYTLA